MGVSLPSSVIDDEEWMRRAIAMAHEAESYGEVPVGAVIVKDGVCIAEGYNLPIKNNDPTAHAEIVAMRAASQQVSNYRLVDCTLYVTLEPCVMCMGAIQHARIKRVVFAAFDKKRGAVCSALSLANADYSNHTIEWTGGVLETECSMLLSTFFKKRR